MPLLIDIVSAGIGSSSFYSHIEAGSVGTPLAAVVTTPTAFDAALRAHNPDRAYVDHDAQGAPRRGAHAGISGAAAG